MKDENEKVLTSVRVNITSRSLVSLV